MKNKKRRFSAPVKVFIWLMIILTLSLVILFAAESRIRPIISSYAASRAELYASKLISEAVDGAMAVETSSPVDVIYNERGVVSIETDTVALSRIRKNAIVSIASSLGSLDRMNIHVPIGNLLGSYFLSGRGVDVNLRIQQTGDITGEIYSEFIESGINQTLHRIYLRLETDIYLFAGYKGQRMRLSNNFTIAETLIVGEVPDAYTAINRFEIDEDEENDLNDYAATLP